MSKPTVVIHGPQGCGKTRHAEVLANLFGCERIVDEWDGVEPLREGTLALTNTQTARLSAVEGVQVVAYQSAVRQLSVAA